MQGVADDNRDLVGFDFEGGREEKRGLDGSVVVAELVLECDLRSWQAGEVDGVFAVLVRRGGDESRVWSDLIQAGKVVETNTLRSRARRGVRGIISECNLSNEG